MKLKLEGEVTRANKEWYPWGYSCWLCDRRANSFRTSAIARRNLVNHLKSHDRGVIPTNIPTNRPGAQTDLWVEHGGLTRWMSIRARGPSNFEQGAVAVIDVSLEARPHYCDRGRWKALVHGSGVSIDWADAFPRYYFDLDRAKAEMEAWLTARKLVPERYEGEIQG